MGEGGEEGDDSRPAQLGKTDIEDGYTFQRLEHSALYLPVIHDEPKVLELLKTSAGDQTCEPGSISDCSYKNKYYI